MSFLRRFVRMVFRSRRVASVELGLAPDSPAASSATPEVSVVVDDGGRPSSGLGTRACSDIAPSDAKHGVSAPSSFPTPSSAVSAPSRFNEVPELEMSRDVRHTTDGNQVPELEMSTDVRHTTD